MNIAVYAICKNEEQFVIPWVESMSEADAIYVLDTGSTDRTVELLRERGVTVQETAICPWRFDTARNQALALLPEEVDICVSTDLDELFRPGWRTALEQAWKPGTQQAWFRYTWDFTPDGAEGTVFWREKIHARRGFRWVHPVHEVLEYTGPGTPAVVCAEGVQLDHHADHQKSRAQYLPLLELAVAESPEDDRSVHYLGREYFFHRRWDDCIRTLRRHLSLPNAQWADERAASLRYIGQAHQALGHPREALQSLLRACGEAPWLREPWLALAQCLYDQEDWAGVLFACRRALRITARPLSYISQADSWGSLPYDLAALACYHLGLEEDAVYYGRQAVNRTPSDQRLRENLRYYEGSVSFVE